jgi:hypothetical protein
MKNITREEAMYLVSMAHIIKTSTDEGAETYANLLAKPHCEGLGLTLAVKGKTRKEIVKQLKEFAKKHYKSTMTLVDGKLSAPSFKRKLKPGEVYEEDVQQSKSLTIEWQKHNTREYELFRGGKQVGVVNVLKVDDKKVVDGKRYEWAAYGTEKHGFEKYLYKAQKNVELATQN